MQDINNDIENDILQTIGDKNYSNIDRGKGKESKESIFFNCYSKSYQNSVYAFNCVEEIYKTFERKVDDRFIPLRLEIDSFFSFIRDNYAKGDNWELSQIAWDENQKYHLNNLINEWLGESWPYFEERIVKINYPLILQTFDSAETIESCSAQQIVDALCVLHSFRDRFRFFKGGLDTLKNEFIESNNIIQIKSTLKYLLFGSGDIVKRMSDCIYDEKYKLNEFGPANVQELIGWINKENLPIINGRTTKVLRYLGFDVKQL